MLLPRLLRRTQAPLTSLTRSESLLRRSFASTSWRTQRPLQADEDSLSKLPGLDASKLSITETITPKKIVPPEDLVFGRTFTGLRPTAPVRLENLLTHSSQTTCCL
jgi:branched-chain amino acid aminotransferase